MKRMLLGFLAIGGMLTIAWGVWGGYAGVEAQENEGYGLNPGKYSSKIAVAGTKEDQGGGLVDVIKKFVNWTLSLLSFVALVVIIYGGYLMVTAAGDDGKYKKGFTILKQAAIGLAVIGLAWFIVSMVFWLVTKTTATG